MIFAESYVVIGRRRLGNMKARTTYLQQEEAKGLVIRDCPEGSRQSVLELPHLPATAFISARTSYYDIASRKLPTLLDRNAGDDIFLS